MKRYCLIENGQLIGGDQQLPHVWRNISGLDLLDDANLKFHGWLPYIDTPPTFDEDTQYLTSEKIIGEDDVTETYIVNDYTVPEMEDRVEAAKLERKASLRDSIDNYLSDKHKNHQTYADAKLAEVDAATTLVEIRAITPNLEAVDSTTSAVRAIFENSILWDVDYSQVDTYIDNNVTTLGEAREFLKKIVKIELALLKFNGLVK